MVGGAQEDIRMVIVMDTIVDIDMDIDMGIIMV